MLESNECAPSDREKVIILGGGPNRIGQGIEFDYCCVHACYALREAGFETIMVNCNPETVSTDYDTADRLYFEPLTQEDVLEIIHAETAILPPLAKGGVRGGCTVGEIAVRQLTVEEWSLFRQIYLTILQTNPEAFGESPTASATWGEEVWRERLRTSAVFALFDKDCPVGLSAIGPHREDIMGKSAFLYYSFVLPEYRRRGLSRLLYAARVDWAKAQGRFEKLVIDHRKGNEAARAMILAQGFSFTYDREVTHAHTGEVMTLACYERPVDPPLTPPLQGGEGRLKGVIVQLGGQTPLGLARALEAEGVPILGTSPDAIDLAEDRERFQRLLNDLNLKQPPNGIARSAQEAEDIAEGIGFPIVLRPSYVLGGQGMEIVHDMAALRRYIGTAVRVSAGSPVLLDRYLKSAIEVDVDAISDGTDVHVAGVMEHIEEAGVHSGDSACVLPPHSLPREVVDEIERQTISLALALEVRGLMNVQFAVRRNDETGAQDIYILEVNPRASRTVPFVAKATGVPVAKIAAQVMAGAALAPLIAPYTAQGTGGGYAVKAPVFPFNRFPGVEPLLGPEMKSTGEVMGHDADLARAIAKAQVGAGVALPTGGTVFLSVRDEDKAALAPIARDLADMGFALLATGGTARFLREVGLKAARVNKVAEGQPHIVDAMINGDIALAINTTTKTAAAAADAHSMRRVALMHKIPYYTLLTAARAGVQAIGALRAGGMTATPLQGRGRVG
jgi:carbamoylphosphate synthase large subunit/RimJ/RimL family protein N-acetyltransferase